MNIIQNLFFMLDKFVYFFAQGAFKVFYYMSNITLLNDDIIVNFTRRIYAIVGIVALFVMAFNLLTYIVDPDKINDKQKGATATIKDICIALFLLTILPMLFTKLYSLQNVVLSNNIISNIILGGFSSDDDTNSNNVDYMEKGANMMIGNIYSAFITPANSDYSVLACKDSSSNPSDALMNEYCSAYSQTLKDGDIDHYKDLYNNEDYTYKFFFSTIGGIVLLFFMLAFCLDLGKRAGKMAILQLLAPVPIIMEILPNKKGTRKTWLNMLVKTYLDVFVYLAVVYLTVFLISQLPGVISKALGPTHDGMIGLISLVLLTFALLQFAKEAPKMVSELLGLKDTGTISAAFKRGTAMAGVAGGLLGTSVGRFAKNFNADSNVNKNLGAKIASGFAGVGGGVARTLWNSRNVHSLQDANKLTSKVNSDLIAARVKRSAYVHAHGGTIDGAVSGLVQDKVYAAKALGRNYFGTRNEYERKKNIEEVNRGYKDLYNSKIASIWKNDARWSQYDSNIKSANDAKNLIDSDEGYRNLNDDQRNALITSYVKQNGQNMTYGELKNYISEQEDLRKNRQSDAIREHSDDFMKGIGSLNTYIDTNQGVDGIYVGRLDEGKAIDAATGKGNPDYLKFVESIVKNGSPDDASRGFEPQLDKLNKDIPYRTQKNREDIARESREATKKAAEDASKGNKNG